MNCICPPSDWRTMNSRSPFGLMSKIAVAALRLRLARTMAPAFAYGLVF